MKVTPLSNRSSAVRDALLSHGWEGDLARLAVGGLEQAAFHVTDIDADTIEAMVPLASRLGLELISGDRWLILIGGRSRLGAFARPWVQPEAVQSLATAVGMALPPEREARWRHARGSIALDHAVIIGVINVTPDSFSDGGAALTIDAALRSADQLIAGGATIIDVGGESTRPGAATVPVDVEQARVIPVIAALAQRDGSFPLSVDTVHAGTAELAMSAQAPRSSTMSPRGVTIRRCLQSPRVTAPGSSSPIRMGRSALSPPTTPRSTAATSRAALRAN